MHGPQLGINQGVLIFALSFNAYAEYDKGLAKMEYEFRRDLAGAPTAQMSTGHEAFGHFLNDEGHCMQTVAELINQVQRVIQGGNDSFRFEGAELAVFIEGDEVLVRAHGLTSHDISDVAEQELELYDAESQASCGLEDFLHLLNSWKSFVTEKRHS